MSSPLREPAENSKRTRALLLILALLVGVAGVLLYPKTPPKEAPINYAFWDVPKVTPRSITSLPIPTLHHPHATEAYNQAIHAWHKGRMDEARVLFTKVTALVPDSPMAYVYLALLSEKEDARRLFERAFEHRNQGSARHQVLIDALWPYYLQDPMDVDLAVRRLEGMRATMPGDADIPQIQGLVLTKVSKASDAIAYFDKALLLDPDDACSKFFKQKMQAQMTK